MYCICLHYCLSPGLCHHGATRQGGSEGSQLLSVIQAQWETCLTHCPKVPVLTCKTHMLNIATASAHKRTLSRRWMVQSLCCLSCTTVVNIVIVFPGKHPWLILTCCYRCCLSRCMVQRPPKERCLTGQWRVWSKMCLREGTLWSSPMESPTLARPSPSWVRILLSSSPSVSLCLSTFLKQLQQVSCQVSYNSVKAL